MTWTTPQSILLLLLPLLWIFSGCGGVAWRDRAYHDSLQSRAQMLLQRPLITGASISADHSTDSPGKKLCLQYTQPNQIRTIARGGTPGAVILSEINESTLMDRTIVVAVDFFFWDSTLVANELSLLALERLTRETAALSIPLVLGDIPALLPGKQPSREALNLAIRNVCMLEKGCYLLKLDELHQQIQSDGFLEVNGKRYSLLELIPDGLHLSEIASTYLGERILELLLKKNSINGATGFSQ